MSECPLNTISNTTTGRFPAHETGARGAGAVVWQLSYSVARRLSNAMSP